MPQSLSAVMNPRPWPAIGETRMLTSTDQDHGGRQGAQVRVPLGMENMSSDAVVFGFLIFFHIEKFHIYISRYYCYLAVKHPFE